MIPYRSDKVDDSILQIRVSRGALLCSVLCRIGVMREKEGREDGSSLAQDV